MNCPEDSIEDSEDSYFETWNLSRFFGIFGSHGVFGNGGSVTPETILADLIQSGIDPSLTPDKTGIVVPAGRLTDGQRRSPGAQSRTDCVHPERLAAMSTCWK